MVVGGRGEEKAKVESGGGWFVGGPRREQSAGVEDERVGWRRTEEGGRRGPAVVQNLLRLNR